MRALNQLLHILILAVSPMLYSITVSLFLDLCLYFTIASYCQDPTMAQRIKNEIKTIQHRLPSSNKISYAGRELGICAICLTNFTCSLCKLSMPSHLVCRGQVLFWIIIFPFI